jgi:hypothetical protein
MAARYSYTMGKRELRRNRRRARPHLRVRIGEHEHDVLNWSLGGVLVAAGRGAGGFAEGVVVRGVMLRADGSDRVEFTAVAARVDAGSGHLALMFETLEEELFAFFERAMAAALRR